MTLETLVYFAPTQSIRSGQSWTSIVFASYSGMRRASAPRSQT